MKRLYSMQYCVNVSSYLCTFHRVTEILSDISHLVYIRMTQVCFHTFHFLCMGFSCTRQFLFSILIE